MHGREGTRSDLRRQGDQGGPVAEVRSATPSLISYSTVPWLIALTDTPCDRLDDG
jgi:hypothetical protein